VNWKAIALVAALALAGCQTDQPTVITTTKYKVVLPPDAMWRCPQIQNLPDPDKLTDIQVAHLISQLSENNSVCRASIEQVKIYLKTAKTKVER
jgi:hypothetical protein